MVTSDGSKKRTTKFTSSLKKKKKMNLIITRSIPAWKRHTRLAKLKKKKIVQFIIISNLLTYIHNTVSPPIWEPIANCHFANDLQYHFPERTDSIWAGAWDEMNQTESKKLKFKNSNGLYWSALTGHRRETRKLVVATSLSGSWANFSLTGNQKMKLSCQWTVMQPLLFFQEM